MHLSTSTLALGFLALFAAPAAAASFSTTDMVCTSWSPRVIHDDDENDGCGKSQGGNHLPELVEASRLINKEMIYQDGQHIVCTSNKHYLFDLSGVCVFPDNTKGGISGDKITELLESLVAFGATDCGNVLIGYPAIKDGSKGMLRVDWVRQSQAGCKGRVCDLADPPLRNWKPPAADIAALSSATAAMLGRPSDGWPMLEGGGE
ncbi:hypothetical protein BU16DRAFT_531880 [Lophium mytilinum]|uniref:Killer toxin Kp4 domain-containing protein n=1 Tax=Lophium mytilinum TaxID=390894 RepID=A0A6A6QBI4_9PEZI|nr:hypothetical protein BU16DRAFT_531880 [Lophium mytilinum]